MAAEWRNASRSTEAQLKVINTLSRYHLFIPYQFLTVSMLLQKQSVWKSILVFGGSFSIKKWINSYESLKLDLSCSRPPLYLYSLTPPSGVPVSLNSGDAHCCFMSVFLYFLLVCHLKWKILPAVEDVTFTSLYVNEPNSHFSSLEHCMCHSSVCLWIIWAIKY